MFEGKDNIELYPNVAVPMVRDNKEERALFDKIKDTDAYQMAMQDEEPSTKEALMQVKPISVQKGTKGHIQQFFRHAGENAKIYVLTDGRHLNTDHPLHKIMLTNLQKKLLINDVHYVHVPYKLEGVSASLHKATVEKFKKDHISYDTNLKQTLATINKQNTQKNQPLKIAG